MQIQVKLRPFYVFILLKFMKLNRRQFLVSAAALAGSSLTACRPNLDNYQQAEQAMRYRTASAETVAALQNTPFYPPALMGLRGDHDGSQTGAHEVALKEKTFTFPQSAPEQFDLIVVGAGVSGLTAAHAFHKQQPEAKILIVDNHDDFGGHAKRNEFTVDGKLLITYGGSESLDNPRNDFSKTAQGLLKDLGVDWQKFDTYYQHDLYKKQWGMKRAVFFRQPAFSENKLTAFPLADKMESRDILAQFPLPDADKAALIELFTAPKDYLRGKKRKEKQKYAAETTYYDFLKNDVKLPEKALAFLTNISMDYWGHPINAISVQDALDSSFGVSDDEGYPGVKKLGIPADKGAKEPYIYHFPDGNATIARLLVRQMIPNVAAGNTMEDVVTAKFDYEQLDKPDNLVKIRLNTTALRIENQGDLVSVGCLKTGQSELLLAQAKKVIYAGHAALAPHIMPEMPQAQKDAMKTNVKIPMVYAKVALKNARAWQKLGVSDLYIPDSPYVLAKLDYPVNIGDYLHAKTPDEPIVLHCVRIATAFDGETARDKYRNGRRALIRQQEEDLKAELMAFLNAFYALAGEKVEDVVAGITLNRWAHGYSYEQVTLWDTDEFTEKTTQTMQQKIGNIFMANCDVAWMPYLQNAIDEGVRAAKEALA